ARQGRGLAGWLRQRAAAEGLQVSEEATRLLIEWVGEDGAVLLGEVRKAALAGGADNRSVGVNEVGAIVGERRLADVFELTRAVQRSEEHTSELQSPDHLVCRLLLEKKKKT